MSDYLVNLKQDWNDLLEEIGTLLQHNPDLPDSRDRRNHRRGL